VTRHCTVYSGRWVQMYWENKNCLHSQTSNLEAVPPKYWNLLTSLNCDISQTSLYESPLPWQPQILYIVNFDLSLTDTEHNEIQPTTSSANIHHCLSKSIDYFRRWNIRDDGQTQPVHYSLSVSNVFELFLKPEMELLYVLQERKQNCN
jgi:hypothetical protein